MSEATEKAALPPYVVPAPPTGDVGSVEDVSQALKRTAPNVELWRYEHPKTLDWAMYRPASSQEVSHWKKASREQSARGALGNDDIPNQELVFACVLFPQRDDLIRLIARRPFILKILTDEICEISGYDGAATSKKV